MTASLFIHAVLIVFGLFFLFTGVISFSRPAPFARTLGLETDGRSGAIEIRAQYGGFFFAAGLSQFAPSITLLTALTIGLVVFGGLILGRLCSLVVDPGGERPLPTIRALYWIDSAGALFAVVCLYLAARGA